MKNEEQVLNKLKSLQRDSEVQEVGMEKLMNMQYAVFDFMRINFNVLGKELDYIEGLLTNYPLDMKTKLADEATDEMAKLMQPMFEINKVQKRYEDEMRKLKAKFESELKENK